MIKLLIFRQSHVLEQSLDSSSLGVKLVKLAFLDLNITFNAIFLLTNGCA
jgi:hypothetical protein